MEIIIAITGASGVVIGARLLEVLSERGEHTVHLILSRGGEDVMIHELGSVQVIFLDSLSIIDNP